MKPISGLVPWAGAAAAALATLAVLYPGMYPFDSAYQLWQARSGEFNDVSPVAMTALWSLLLQLTSNPATLLVMNLVMFWTGLALCVAATASNALVRVALLCALGASPLALVEFAHLLSDAHLAAILVLATGLLAWGITSKRRGALLACSLLLIYAGCVRHNALLAIPPYGAVIALAANDGQHRRGLAAVLGAAALTVVSALAGVALNRGLVVESVSVWPTIALWDLAAISVDSNTLLLPSFTHGPGMTAAELRDTGAFDSASNTLLFQKSRSGMRDGLTAPYAGEQLRDLRAAWIDAVQQHPIEYARHRARTFWLLVGPHRGDIQGKTYFVDRMQYRDNPPFPPPLAPAAQQTLYALAADLQSSWLFAALPYLLLNAVALTVGWRRRVRPTARVALAVSSSALLYAATLLLVAPSAELRYLTWPIVAGPLALAFALSKRQWHCRTMTRGPR